MATCKTCGAPVNLAPDGDPKYEAVPLGLPRIEAVASRVHSAWVLSKKEQGMTSRKAEDGEELMVSYELLSDRAKEYDRVTVRAVYAAIRAAS